MTLPSRAADPAAVQSPESSAASAPTATAPTATAPTATAPRAAPLKVPLSRSAPEVIASLESTVAQVVRGKPEVIRLAVVALLAGGHILIEDVPGVGKTTLAQTLARALGLAFQRIQFTSDLLPTDIIGVSIYQQDEQRFDFIPGPLFANIVLADEINRATPKTQSALLEAMSERHVSVDRKRYTLPSPFLVLATQNPLEYLGTYPLPESQLDRFMMSLKMGYPPREDEKALLLSGGVRHLVDQLPAALSEDELRALQNEVKSVLVSEKIADYILAIADATRDSGEFALPVSTRGAQNLYAAAQALALCEQRQYAIPDDVQKLAIAVLGHRVVLKRAEGDLDASRAAIGRIVASLPVPT